MSDSVEAEVRRIIAKQALLDPADISDHQSFDDLGMDSLARVETIFAIEEAFGIEVPFNANMSRSDEFDVSTVGSVVTGVRGLISSKTR